MQSQNMSTANRKDNKSHQPIEDLFAAACPRLITFTVKSWESNRSERSLLLEIEFPYYGKRSITVCLESFTFQLLDIKGTVECLLNKSQGIYVIFNDMHEIKGAKSRNFRQFQQRSNSHRIY